MKISKFSDAGSNNWNDGMTEKGINNMEWIEREEWRKKIKLLAQKEVKTLKRDTNRSNHIR